STSTVGTTNYTWSASTRVLTLRHRYLDDGPSPGNGTPQDLYHPVITVTEDDGGTASNNTSTITVNNGVPSLVNIIAANINEGDFAEFSAALLDAGTLDVISLNINWQDGNNDVITGLGPVNQSGVLNPLTNYTYVASTRILTIRHRY